MNLKGRNHKNKNKPSSSAPSPPWQINASSTMNLTTELTGESTNSVLTDAQSDLGLYKTV